MAAIFIDIYFFVTILIKNKYRGRQSNNNKKVKQNETK